MHCFIKRVLVIALCVPTGMPLRSQVVGYSSSDPAYFSGQEVSLIQLIANPLTYSGKRVRVLGFVTFEFEGEGLYLHKEDLDHRLDQNAIRFVIPAQMSRDQRAVLDKKYVICEGTFVALKHGHEEPFANGTLTKITRLEKWSW